MGLHDEFEDGRTTSSAVTSGRWGSYTARLVVGAFLSGVVWMMLYMWSRGVNLNSTTIGDPLQPAFISGGAFAVMAGATATLSGGYVFFTNVLMLWFVGFIAHAWRLHRYFLGPQGKIVEKKVFADSSDFIKNLHGVSILWFLIAHFAGYLVGGYGAWGVLESFAGDTTIINGTVASPGPFPGLDSNYSGRAFLVEILVPFFIGTIVNYYHLCAMDRSAAMSGGLAVFIAILLTYNISGSSLDSLAWIVAHVVIGTASGHTAFAGTSLWWWAYLFGPMIGYFFAAVFALVLYMLYDVRMHNKKLVRGNVFRASAADAVAVAGGNYAPYHNGQVAGGYTDPHSAMGQGANIVEQETMNMFAQRG